jgi:threonine/homoserine/homoserine lactone efflux protein
LKLYPVFVLVAAATVASPGPGVVLTLTNALRHRAADTLGGILGLAAGAFAMAAASATGLGLLLSTSPPAFTVLKLLGAAYLVWLGIRLWREPAVRLREAPTEGLGVRARFVEALGLQLTNPKVVVFFLSVFPQFVAAGEARLPQFAVLVLTYAALILVIHSAYALTARRSRPWLASERGLRVVQRIGGGTFVCFGVALASVRL